MTELPPRVREMAEPFLADPRTRYARERFLIGLLQGMTTFPIPEEHLVRGLEDMAVAGTNFTPIIVRTWAQRAGKLLEGEAGRREALKQPPVSGQPDANQRHPEGFSEDEMGDE